MAVYSFGEDSPIKFTLSDKTALRYNEAVDKFIKAQQRFNQKFCRRWDPTKDPIALKWTKKQMKAWNEFSKVFDKVAKETGPFHPNDMMDDFLVKNLGGAVAVSTAGNKWGRILYSAAVCGSLYAVLRGRKR